MSNDKAWEMSVTQWQAKCGCHERNVQVSCRMHKAAPEMLAALEAVQQAGQGRITGDYLAMVDHAIRKAKGEA